MPAAIETLWETLSPLTVSVAAVAARELESAPQLGSGLLPALIAGLLYPAPQVKAVALAAIEKVGSGSPEAVRAVLAIDSDPDPRFWQFGLVALAKIGAGFPSAREFLIEVVKGSDDDARGTAVFALGLLGENHPEVVGALLNTLSHANERLATTIAKRWIRSPPANLSPFGASWITGIGWNRRCGSTPRIDFAPPRNDPPRRAPPCSKGSDTQTTWYGAISMKSSLRSAPATIPSVTRS